MHTPEDIDWEAVYNEQMPRIYNFFRYRFGDDQLAEDLTATTFEKAWKARERYRHDLSAFSTWLLSIARNTALDTYKGQHSHIGLEEVMVAQEGRPVEETAERDDDFNRLAALLESLTARERELIALRYGAGLTNRAIADITDISESNVGTILYRVIQRLRAQWEVKIR